LPDHPIIKKKLERTASLILDLKLNHIGFESTLLSVSHPSISFGKAGYASHLIPLEEELKNLRAEKMPKN